MLVRSQNNQRITDKIEFQAIKDGSGDWVILHIGGYKIFAIYSTFEKAIKSLDMIEQAYRREEKVFQFPAEEELEDEE